MKTLGTIKLTLCLLAVLMLTARIQAAGLALSGEVQGSHQAIAGSQVRLFAGAPGKATLLAESQTDSAGRFSFNVQPANGAILYLIASGGRPRAGAGAANSAIGLFAVLGSAPPSHVVVNELTTVASAWSAVRLYGSGGLTGNATGLRIAAGNVPSLVDLKTGGFGGPVQDPLNGAQSTTLARFATLGDLLAGCVDQAVAGACADLFSAARLSPEPAPSDTFGAALAIARHPWHNTEPLFNLLAKFYPASDAPYTAAPFAPYLIYAPSTWALAIRYGGGGLNAPGGISIDGEGTIWSTNNFLPGSQSRLQQALGGHVSKTAADGKPLSPATFGFAGGGIVGGGFGIAIRGGDLWAGNYQGNSVSVLRMSDAAPLSPPSGYTLGGKLGHLQGLILDLKSNVWVVDNENSQVALFPDGDPARARLLCGQDDPKCHVSHPFHLAVDQKNQIWITNGGTGSGSVTRFPADQPELAEQFPVGKSPKGIAIDSQGEAWIANFESSNVSHLLADGRPAPGSPYKMPSIVTPWGIAVDGDDHVWVAAFGSKKLVELCGSRPELCPPGVTTGQPIAPEKSGYDGGGLQHITAVAIDPAGNVWVANNWDDPQACAGPDVPAETASTLCGGNGLVVFLGLAKPVATPLLGPPRLP